MTKNIATLVESRFLPLNFSLKLCDVCPPLFEILTRHPPLECVLLNIL